MNLQSLQGSVRPIPKMQMQMELAPLRNAFRDAARLAGRRGLAVHDVGFGIRARLLTYRNNSFVMVLPLNTTQVAGPATHDMIMETGRLHERETNFAIAVFSRFCGKIGPQLVLDVGSNVGYYSLIAAAFGCKVMAFDGNLEALDYLKMSIIINDFSDRVNVMEALVSNVTEIEFNGWNVKADSGANSSPAFVTTRSVKLDDVIHEPVLYAKVDVEGWEPAVFASAKEMFQKEPPLYIFFEMTYYLEKWKHEYLEVFMMLAAAGYMCESHVLEKMFTMPTTNEAFDAMLKEYSFICDPTKTHFCQDEFSCILPWPSVNQLSSKS
ncbi:hypothetical protein Vretifemale_1767 [Volvox reticuliferus]|uniref:Methyltransferase FkbM domain-containing protein n=1 Tax=Volvox reticuliferus TaxID=1737510 RepID=A0A8J4FD03_9CHLO|nr:hypothetical protein Vretifemale_1767 [Volvox reticuliferus]